MLSKILKRFLCFEDPKSLRLYTKMKLQIIPVIIHDRVLPLPPPLKNIGHGLHMILYLYSHLKMWNKQHRYMQIQMK